ncbi:hypothetical protein [Caulobacter sp. FWC2]|uniref:hypothetical protein n=1 Tax=Caulobacter sp. FWC2 TaxID=69664 RepID=UPI000C14E0DD|nr:hypothetical protein [Caulobacter sp. FWC2]PIB92745.1 hypothetical protein CSW62_14935 [Caulobacter sp. FWC2]
MDDRIDLQDFLGLPGMFEMQRHMSRVAPDEASEAAVLTQMDPVRAATIFGALLTAPELQSNCARLEMLVHQALALGKGSKKPSETWLASRFRKIGEGRVGRLEDPAEDVFVSLICTSRGDFRILEGIWEGAGFYLQRFVNVVEGMPEGAPYDELRVAIFSLLRLSDLVCERSKLWRNQLGSAYPQDTIPRSVLSRAASLQRRVRFTLDELRSAGVSLRGLAPFAFRQDGREELLNQKLGHTDLERRPLVIKGQEVFFVLPTAASAAIRRFLLERLDALGARETFLAALGRDYLALIESMPLLGGRMGARLHFHRGERFALAGGTIEADQGRYLNLVLLLDTLEGIETTGLIDPNPDPGQVTDVLQTWIGNAYRQAQHDPNFVDGLTVIVGCGVGRAAAHALPDPAARNWRLEFLSAPELCTLSWAHGFSPLSLWRLLDGQEALERGGVALQSINGLLNLVAWSRSLGGHLVPHGQLPDDFGGGDHADTLMVPQNLLRDLRHEVAMDFDVHVRADVTGRQLTVRWQKDRIFAEDDAERVYVSDEDRERRGSAGVFITPARDWWFDILVPDDLPATPAHDYWLMLRMWIVRAAPVLDRCFPGLGTSSLLIEGDFTDCMRNGEARPAPLNYPQVRAGLVVTADLERRTVVIKASEAFERGGFHVDNIAEQALVAAIAVGVAGLAGETLDAAAERQLVDEICPDPKARHRHTFAVATFLDQVRADIPKVTVRVDRDDDALLRLGLGWRAHERSEGAWIRGKADAMRFLNRTVRLLEEELCADLRHFGREALIRALLYNHEAAAAEGQRWGRTAAAILALRKDKDAVRDVISKEVSERAEVSQTSRSLVELALCEAPLEGRAPGALDLSRLMAKMGLILVASGWSGAIRWDVMEPTLKISPLGDVLAKLDFVEEILAPFARAFSDVSVDASVAKYAKNLEEADITPAVEHLFEGKFTTALAEELGAPIDAYRQFVDWLENRAIDAGKAVLKMKKSQLLLAPGDARGRLRPEHMPAILSTLTLTPRAGWRSPDNDIDPRDLEIWRFRRRLSVLRRPLLQIDDTDDPSFLISPGLARQGFGYTLGSFYDGSFPSWQLGKAMTSWAAVTADKRGKAFSVSIGELLTANGWQIAEPDLKITKLLRKGFERDHGDVDVLAWRPADRRVLIIECKDLQFKKNLGEIAEQLADFRGEMTQDGKRDYLRKHLDRIELLDQHHAEIARFIGWDVVDKLESHLVFKNPVPMQFALDRLREQVTVSTAKTLLSTLEEGG